MMVASWAFLWLIVAVSCFTIEKGKAVVTTADGNVGFIDDVGSSTRQMRRNFTNFVEAATGFYKDDIKANAEYISEQMGELFGSSDTIFNIYIQTEPVKTLIKNSYFADEPHASFAPGINKLRPQWSYMFHRRSQPVNIAFISRGRKGADVTDQKEDTIRGIVQQYETGDACTCDKDEFDKIRDKIGSKFPRARLFTMMCEDRGVTNALVNTLNDFWISTQPKNCWYTIVSKP